MSAARSMNQVLPIHDMRTRWSPLAVHGFELVFRPWMARRLSGVYIAGLPCTLPPDRSIILAANHVSWWDGFLLWEIHRQCGVHVPLVTLMKAEELRRFPFFRWMGVVGLGNSTAGVRAALRDLAVLRRRQPVWLSVFPQGRMYPSWKRPLGFRPGLRIFANVLAPAIILPVGLHLEPSNKPGLAAYISIGSPLDVDDAVPDVSEVEARVAAALDAIHAALSTYGEAAPLYWGNQPAGRPNATFEATFTSSL